MTLTGLMGELAEERRKNPTDDLTSALMHNDLDEDMLDPEEIGPFFILLAVAGNDTTRTAISHGMHLLAENPDQRRIWQDDLEGVTPRRSRRSCATRRR
jgi:methyl-branched lipid omega-hydroxylase